MLGWVLWEVFLEAAQGPGGSGEAPARPQAVGVVGIGGAALQTQGPGVSPPQPNAADRQPVMGVLPDTVRPGSFCLILSGNAVHPRPGRRRRAPRRRRVEVEVHCPSGRAAALTRWCAPAQARGPHVLPGHRPHWTSPPMTLAGDPLALGWAFCHSHNKPLGQLRVWGHRPGLCPPGAQPPPQPRGPPTRVLCHHTQWALPQGQRDGSVVSPTPAAQPGALPRAVTSSLTPHTGTRQGCLRRARQKPPSPPTPTHGGKRTGGRQWPRNPAAPPTPCSVGGWRALGVRPHPPPRARSWGRRGTGGGQPPPPFLRSQVPTTCLWGLGGWGACSPGAPQPPSPPPTPDFGSPHPAPSAPQPVAHRDVLSKAVPQTKL